MKKKDEIKVCLVGSSGGHLTHLYMLKPFWKDKNRFWVTFDKEDARSLLEGEKVFEAKYPTTGDEEDEPDMMGGGDLTDWALEMEAKRKKVKNYDIQVVTAWGRLVKLDGSTQITNLAGLVCGLYAKAAVQESIGKTRTEAGFGIPKTKLLELLPAEMDNSITAFWNEYTLVVVDRWGNRDESFPALPGVRSKAQYKVGAVVAVAMAYGDSPAIIGEVQL